MQLNTHDFPSAGVREAALYWLSGGMSTLSEGQRCTLPLTYNMYQSNHSMH